MMHGQKNIKFFLVYFVNLYMFQTYLGPSSGRAIVCILQPGQQTVISNE